MAYDRRNNTNANQTLNSMTGDVSYDELAKIQGISTIALAAKAMSGKFAIFRRKQKRCPLTRTDMRDIDYKNLYLMLQFVSKCGRITSSRVSGVSKKKQRKLVVAIKRARFLGLLFYVNYGDI